MKNFKLVGVLGAVVAIAAAAVLFFTMRSFREAAGPTSGGAEPTGAATQAEDPVSGVFDPPEDPYVPPKEEEEKSEDDQEEDGENGGQD